MSAVPNLDADDAARMDSAEKPAAEMRWRGTCAYVGTTFEGWQAQASGRAVQDHLEKCLAKIFGRPIRIHGSGRTDSGVHARGQVFHFDASWRHGGAKFLTALAAGLPPSIQLRSLRVAAPDFHARFHATGKIYSYHLRLGDADPFTRPYVWCFRRPLDTAAMARAAAVLRGQHDFKAFAAFNGVERADTVRTLRRLDVQRRGRRVRILAEADGFLYKMVRSLVGALVAVGEGKLTVERLREIRDSRQRTSAVPTAPAQGLFLERVFY